MKTCLDWVLVISSIITSLTAIIAIYFSIISFQRNSKITLQPQRSKLWMKHLVLISVMRNIFNSCEYEKSTSKEDCARRLLQPLSNDGNGNMQFLENSGLKILGNTFTQLNNELEASLGIFEPYIIEHISKNAAFANLLYGVSTKNQKLDELVIEVNNMYDYYSPENENQIRINKRVFKYLKTYGVFILK